jgi:general secretion pathway protein C
VEQRINSWLKNLAGVVQQKLDLTNASFPPFSKILKWSSIVAGAIIASAAANYVLIKFVLFSEIKTAKVERVDVAAVALVRGSESLKSEDFKAVWKRNLFNSEQKEEVVKDSSLQAVCTASKSDLPLRFTGVIYGGNKETSLVLLESAATKQADTFVLNDFVPGDAKIVDIQRDKVLFLRGGTGCPEFLELQQPEVIKRRAPNQARSRSSAPKASGGAGAYEFVESGFARSKDGNIVADRRWVDKALGTDMAKTLQDAKASPNLVNGEVKGFVLTRIRPDSVYEKMGFQDGDVVEQINGIDLNDAARAIQTLNSLRNENGIELMVKRNGVAVPLKIQVK